ncbi:MAG: PQQ-binding-like beta-propeller repeat protein [Candidatus Melainabacteria bacterium]|nr:PQQ-binding-like beta-propeller repeat protein [Candidatus Melainabacteria bacterium]
MSAILSRNDRLGGGHYTVIKELGVGGMGVVYHCRDEFLQRDVAIKMLLPELLKNPRNLEVFTQEARLAAHLEHPNIVTVYDIGVEDRENKSHHFVAMEYLPGGNLGSQTAAGALPVEHALNWMKQLANGLYFAHKKNVIHQDIKADNIFITTEGDLKIGDFGLARLMENKVFINPSTKGMGTPAYMSPELCRGEQQDHRSDIYSLGVLFFEMATGQLPYRAEGMIEMAMKHTTAPIPSVRRINSQVPAVIDKMIRRMMEKLPEDRFQSLAEVIKILDDLIFELRVARMGLKEEQTQKSREDRKPEPEKTPEKKPERKPENKPDKKTQDERMKAAGIKLPEQVGPIRQPTVDIEKHGKHAKDLRSPRISAGAVPVLEGLNPLLTERWRFATGGPVGWESMPILSESDHKVLIASTDGLLYKLEPEDGSLIWSSDLGDSIMGSPVVRGNHLFAASAEGILHQVEASTGAHGWKRDLEGSVVSSPAVWGQKVLVATKEGRLCCLDAETGEGLWAYDSGHAVVGGLSIYGNLVFFGNRGKRVICLDLRTGRKVWRAKVDGPVVTSPAVSVDSLYVGTQKGTFYAIDVESGQTLWEYPTSQGIIAGAQIIFTSVIFCSQDKWLYCCEKYDGSLKWKAAVKGRVQASLASAAKTVIAVSKEGWMQAFDIHIGQLRWQKNFATRLESRPLVLSDGMIVASVDGLVTYYSFGAEVLKKSA